MTSSVYLKRLQETKPHETRSPTLTRPPAKDASHILTSTGGQTGSSTRGRPGGRQATQ